MSIPSVYLSTHFIQLTGQQQPKLLLCHAVLLHSLVPCTCMHSHTHTHTHAHTHTCIHTHTHTHTHPHMHAHTCMHAHTHSRADLSTTHSDRASKDSKAVMTPIRWQMGGSSQLSESDDSFSMLYTRCRLCESKRVTISL